jgi:prepilin-type N-terminal cleavage/methylation domain-containing protein
MRVRIQSIRKGFSLIELVIVVVIIAVIGAIAVVRFTRGASAANDAALNQNWSELRKAIDRYAAEHGVNPDRASIADQLTMYTDDSGATLASPDDKHIYGPYLRVIPALNTGPRSGQNGIGTADGPTIGWIYAQKRGEIRPNVPFVPELQEEVDGTIDLSP